MSLTTIERIEENIGSHLQLLADKLDLSIRQGDQDVIRALRELTDGWKDLCFLMNADRWGRTCGKPFLIDAGNSVIDALWSNYYTERVKAR
jgi:hypothetical protein